MNNVVVMSIYDKYTIPESYRHEWDNTIIKGLTQPSAHLTNYALTLGAPNGEYIKMPMVGSATVHRKMQRHQRKIWEEPKFNDRRIYPVMYAATLGLSDDDFVLKGDLPLSLPMLHDMMVEAAAPIPDRVLLGVVYDETKGNCVIAGTGANWSPYLSSARNYKNPDGSTAGPDADKVSGGYEYTNPDGTKVLIKDGNDGQLGGLLGTNWVSEGTYVTFPTQPVIGSSLADNYSAYSSDLSGLSLKATNVIPVNYVRDGGTVKDSGLTIEKLRAARLALQLRHGLSANEEVCMAITPWQMDDLLSLEELMNKDYGFQSLKTGEINTFLGIRFLVTVDVPIVNVGGKWVRCCPMWKRSSVAFATWQNPKSEVVKIPDSYDTWLTSVQFAYGAARRREEDIICVHCAEGELASIS